MNILDEIIDVIIDESIGIKKRVRNGGKRVQRRFKFSKLKSKSFNNKTKKKKTITTSDRAKIKRIQRIAAKKRLAKKSVANVKRKRSNRKRKNLGFNK